ncbi:response regulator transcription factor [Enterococcus rotai]|uniref:response regulator transcription factor n=1 Tax=Enterococcus rotai TaxID=118060 RepID=UPI0032B46DE5
MYNIGIISSSETIENTYTNQLSKTFYHVHKFSADEGLVGTNLMDVLIIEEVSGVGLKSTCELILELRRGFRGLIWVVSQSISKSSKLVYLQLGADGIADKEMEQEETVLQISNLLRRIYSKSIADEEGEGLTDRVSLNNSFDVVPENLSIMIEGYKEIGLTKLEFQIISYLIDRLGKAVTYEELYKHLWKDEYSSSSKGNKQYRVSNLIFHLRKKIEKDPSKPEYIKTIRSKGYMLVF